MQVEHFKVELANKSIQASLCKFVTYFFQDIWGNMQLLRPQEKRYILMIYVFQLRKFAIVKKKKKAS